jgi:phospholipase/carboxylesterase
VTSDLAFLSSADVSTFVAGDPVVVLLHGYGSNERDLPGLAGHLPSANQWVSPRGPLETDFGGFAWFPLAAPGNPRIPDVEGATEQIWSWIDATLPAESPIIAIGFSQGGLMASQLLRTRPDRIAATAIFSGFVLNAPQPGDDVIHETRSAVFYSHGLDDRVIAPDAVERAVAWVGSLPNGSLHSYPGLAHSIDGRVLADLIEFLDAAV